MHTFAIQTIPAKDICIEDSEAQSVRNFYGAPTDLYCAPVSPLSGICGQVPPGSLMASARMPSTNSARTAKAARSVNQNNTVQVRCLHGDHESGAVRLINN